MTRGCAITIGLLALWMVGFLVFVPLLAEVLYDQSPLKGTGSPFNEDAFGALGLAIVVYFIGTATLVVIYLRRQRK